MKSTQKELKVPGWAYDALMIELQELEMMGHNLSKLSARDTLDFVYDAKPKEMTYEQWEKEVEPAVLALARSHGLK